MRSRNSPAPGEAGASQQRHPDAAAGAKLFSRESMDATADPPRRSLAFGLERAGFLGLGWPRLTILIVVLASVLAAFGLARLKVDDSLSELFRTDTEEFRRYEEIDRRFPSSEYDVLAVVEGKDLLKRVQLDAFRTAIVDLQLLDDH